MNYFAGIDIGSTAIKIVLIDEESNIIASRTTATGSHFHTNTIEALEYLLEKAGIERDKVTYMMATGYGRKLFKDADERISEISANAAGARHIGKEFGDIKTIINLGGQDAKVIVLDDDGHVKNFVMNDKCAAGTGRFLEVAARNLEIEVSDLGDCHLKAEGSPIAMNSTCTVFAESEIISLLANDNKKEDIIAALHYSIAKRVARLAKRGGLEGPVFFDGGPAMNKGLVAALEDELMCEVIVPGIPQTTTACGAAVLAKEAYISSSVSADA